MDEGPTDPKRARMDPDPAMDPNQATSQRGAGGSNAGQTGFQKGHFHKNKNTLRYEKRFVVEFHTLDWEILKQAGTDTVLGTNLYKTYIYDLATQALCWYLDANELHQLLTSYTQAKIVNTEFAMNYVGARTPFVAGGTNPQIANSNTAAQIQFFENIQKMCPLVVVDKTATTVANSESIDYTVLIKQLYGSVNLTATSITKTELGANMRPKMLSEIFGIKVYTQDKLASANPPYDWVNTSSIPVHNFVGKTIGTHQIGECWHTQYKPTNGLLNTGEIMHHIDSDASYRSATTQDHVFSSQRHQNPDGTHYPLVVQNQDTKLGGYKLGITSNTNQFPEHLLYEMELEQINCRSENQLFNFKIPRHGLGITPIINDDGSILDLTVQFNVCTAIDLEVCFENPILAGFSSSQRLNDPTYTRIADHRYLTSYYTNWKKFNRHFEAGNSEYKESTSVFAIEDDKNVKPKRK